MRKYLIETDEKADIRLIYLAFSHMIKYRGNFLRDGDIGNVADDYDYIVAAFDELNAALEIVPDYSDEAEVKFSVTKENAKSLIDAFKRGLGKSDLLDEEKKVFKFSDKHFDSLLQLINGSDKDVKKIFPDFAKDNPELAKINVSFDQEDYETVLSSSGLPDEYLNLLFTAKKIYEICLLASLLHGRAYISDAMVDIYENHKKQLRELKKLYEEIATDKYDDFFNKMPPEAKDGKKKGADNVNYASYVGVIKLPKRRKTTSTKRDGFDMALLYKRICADLCVEERLKEDAGTDEKLARKLKSIKEEMDKGSYLRIQNNKSNGVLPYQLNKNEMQKIIEKQKRHYPFLGDKAPSFLNPEDKLEYKIISILEYKVPYFVGPLKTADKPSDNRWVVFNEDNDKNVPITPWNFYQKINATETAKGFMERLKNNCTYLFGESTLPKFSLTYLEYLIYNELNCVYKNEKTPLSSADKQYLFEEVYKKHKKVSIKDLESKLSELYRGEKVKLRPRSGGEDDEKLSDILKTSYSSYVDLADKKGLGPNFDKDKKEKEKAEAVIYLVTVFEDKKQLQKQLKALDPNFTKEQIQYFSSLKFKDWGRLSKKLLTGSNGSESEEIKILSEPIVVEPDLTSAKPRSIMELLKYTSKNFNEIYFDSDYGFAKTVKKFNDFVSGTDVDINDIIDNSYGSQAVKRALRQTIGIVDELKRILGIPDFSRIFVECTREAEKDPKKKSSRREKLNKLYEVALKMVKAQKDLIAKEDVVKIEDLKSELKEKDDDDLRAKKIFYYFAQFGHDVYSGESLSLEDLKDYDVDHIIPQSIVKDDSFLNTVLTKKITNNEKSDDYPINDGKHKILTKKGKDWVEFLNRIHKNDYMSDEKKNRILRTTPLSPEELEGFVNRQIVTTNQAVKTVCDILKRVSKAEIVYSKAANVSEFRNVFDLIKLRDLNDFHHANDAYLNIVVGNVYKERFSFYSRKWIEEQLKSDPKFQCGVDVTSVFLKTPMGKMTKEVVNMSTGQVAWLSKFTEDEANKKWRDRDPLLVEGTIERVRKTLSWNDPMITQALRTQKGKQGFFNKIAVQKSAKNPEESNKNCVVFPLKTKNSPDNPFNKGDWLTKYGHYTDMTSGYFYLVSSKEKGKTIYSVEAIPTIVFGNQIHEKDEIEKWLADNYKLIEPQLVFDPSKKLLIRSVIEVPSKSQNGKEGYMRFGLSGKTDVRLIVINLSELHLPHDKQKYFKSIVKILGKSLPKGAKKDLSVYGNEMQQIIEGTHVLSKDKNKEMYRYLVDYVYSRPEYENFSGKISARFKCTKDESNEKDRNHFEDLPIIKQAEIIFTMIRLLTCKSVQKQDISLLNPAYPKNVGLLAISKKLEPGTRIVEESKTGFYRRVLFEVK